MGAGPVPLMQGPPMPPPPHGPMPVCTSSNQYASICILLTNMLRM